MRTATGRTSSSQGDPGPLFDVRCDNHPDAHVPSTTLPSLRMLGWRIWDGATIGGGAASVTLCPSCTGRAPTSSDEADTGVPTAPFGWNASCDTCHSSLWDDEGTDGMGSAGWTRDDASDWMLSHECEPDTRLIRPHAEAVSA